MSFPSCKNAHRMQHNHSGGNKLMAPKYFETQGPVDATVNYVVSRQSELADFIQRVQRGRYIVLFAPRQTGKTTFFRWALNAVAAADATYVPIQCNFEVYAGYPAARFYAHFAKKLRQALEDACRTRGIALSPPLAQFLANATMTDQVEMLDFFEALGQHLAEYRVVLLIDEFDGIPPEAVTGFLHALRHIYLSDAAVRCPYSIGIVGVKNITQLNYDRTISPFNIQEEFHLPGFTLAQVQELLAQYTAEVGQLFEPAVIETLHRQTAGQPFLVNRLAQLLTQELAIPKDCTIALHHFAQAHQALLTEDNVNFNHLTTNVQRDPRFERLLMRIAASAQPISFNPRNDVMQELATYGVIAKGTDGKCEIVNPIYQYCVMQAFQPAVNGLEEDYFPANTRAGYQDYLTPDGDIALAPLLDNFRDFITRAGFRVLQVPRLPRESVGQHLLAAYLDGFVKAVGGFLYLEVPTGRGRTDLIILHNRRKYIVETKIWGGTGHYEAGKKQLVAYLKLEGAVAGYYIVFDHRQQPQPRVETEHIDGQTLRCYVIPVVQKRPSDAA